MNIIAKHAKIAVVIAVLCGAMSGTLSAMTAIPALGIGFLRLTIAVPFFLIPVLRSPEKRAQLKAISRRDLFLSAASGVFLFAHFFSWFSAVKLTNVASAAVLASLHPLVVLLVTVLIMKKKVSWKSVAAIIVALLGGAVIMGFDLNTLAGSHLTGNILGFLAGMFMGLYFSVGDSVRKRVDGGLYVLLVFGVCWICFAVGVAATGTSILGYTGQDYLYVVLMAFICQMGSHGLFNLCIGHVSSLYVSTIESGDPVFSTLAALILMGQVPAVYEIAGCMIVVGALIYYNYEESRVKTE